MKTAVTILAYAILTLTATTNGVAKKQPAGWLGVSVQDMTSRLARSMHVQTRDGVVVNDVVNDSPADSADIKDEDIIVEFNKEPIDNANDLIDAVRRTAPGTPVNIVVMRNEDRKTIGVRIGKLPCSERGNSYFFETPAIPPVPRVRIISEHDILGLSLTGLNEQLGEYFETPDSRGVLVQEVEKGSESDKAGFKAGDVIIKAGKETVEDPGDVTSVVAEAEEGDKVDFEIIRKGGRKTLTVEVEDAPEIHRFHFNRKQRSGMFFERRQSLRPELDRIGRELRNHLMILRDTIRGTINSIFS